MKLKSGFYSLNKMDTLYAAKPKKKIPHRVKFKFFENTKLAIENVNYLSSEGNKCHSFCFLSQAQAY